jgi:CO/xanthine dehydrogenase FAD-binding subunit
MLTLLPKFEYYSPRTLEEALEFLEKVKSSYRVLAGGTDLLLEMKHKLRYPANTIVDISKLNELRYVKEKDGFIGIGSLTRIEDLKNSEIIRKRLPILAEIAAEFGTWQIRNMATIGGNVCNGSSSADYSLALLILDAELHFLSLKGERRVKSELFINDGNEAIKPGELLIEITIPKLQSKAGTSFLKYEGRRVSSIPILNVACMLELEDTFIKDVRIALGGVEQLPRRLKPVEEKLKELDVRDIDKVDRVLQTIPSLINPRSGVVASAEYRRAMSYVFVKRALLQALERCS